MSTFEDLVRSSNAVPAPDTFAQDLVRNPKFIGSAVGTGVGTPPSLYGAYKIYKATRNVEVARPPADLSTAKKITDAIRENPGTTALGAAVVVGAGAYATSRWRNRNN
ncbi:hypothetical protein V8F06_007118 [Rhypophila decipiens]